MGLTNAQLMELLAKPLASERPKSTLVKTGGKLVWTNDKHELGKFEGKQAPKTRSRKGNIRPGKGGHRVYVPGGEWWDEEATQVVAYMA